MSVVIRGGHPTPFRGTAPAAPGVALGGDNELLPFHFMVDCPTVWFFLENNGAVPLRIFFKKPPLDPADYRDYIDIPVKAATERGFIEGLYEVSNLWIMGVGGTCDFQALPGRRVI
jgi:hypothetical protein